MQCTLHDSVPLDSVDLSDLHMLGHKKYPKILVKHPSSGSVQVAMFCLTVTTQVTTVNESWSSMSSCTFQCTVAKHRWYNSIHSS